MLLSKVKTKQRELFLTFDDGPVEPVTPAVLALLESYDAHATFFVQGNKSTHLPAIISEIAMRGHTVGNHSYDHPRFDDVSHAERCRQVGSTNRIINELTGTRCQYYRAPRGQWDLRMLLFLLRTGMQAVHWTRDSEDYRKPPSADIIQSFTANPVTSGDIILFHDDNDLCIEVLSVLIPTWLRNGFKLSRL
jgi:peptidoglycan/xylan/chitin deacetylase (PgdA/CDA1 family)